MTCPVCKCFYTKTNVKSRHHIYPLRFNFKNFETFTLCRNCHNELESLIPLFTKLTEGEYLTILNSFIKLKKSHNCFN